MRPSDQPWTSPLWRAWLVLSLVAVAVMAADLLRLLMSVEPSLRESLLYRGTMPVFWWVMLPLVRRNTSRHAVGAIGQWRTVGAQLAWALAIGVLAWLVYSLRLLLANRLPLSLYPLICADSFDWDDLYLPAVVTYLVLALPFYATDFYRNWQQKQHEAAELVLANAHLETRLVRANLEALKMQMQPHFLFNTLNSITGLIRRGRTRQAEDIVAGLGELLRRSLEYRQELRVTLDDELRFLRRYLEIESIRFQDRLQVEIDVPADCASALVPSLLLQPLVENAMKHGISRDPEARILRISARRQEARLLLRVFNDGPALPRAGGGAPGGLGIGTQNTRARLQMMYGELAALELNDARPRGVNADVWLPFQTTETETV